MKTEKGNTFVGGKIDRIDEANGVTRLLDYKTGKDVTPGKGMIIEDLFKDIQLQIQDWKQHRFA